MYVVNSVIAAWLSALLFPVPEPNYWEIFCAQTMRSKVLPYIPGF